MNKTSFTAACLITLSALLLNFQLAFAHESVAVGDYEIEIGWVDEPAVVGEKNAIAINVSNTSSAEAQPAEDVSSLTVTVSYGGLSKELTLEPLGEDTPGQFAAPLLPTVPGEYMIKLGGSLGDTAVDAEVHPEEVLPADTIQFPGVQAEQQSTTSGARDWLVWLSLLIGLVGVGLGVTAIRKAG